MEAADFSLKGGLEFERGQLEKADLELLLDKKLWELFPSAVVSRMKMAKNGRLGFQFLFHGTTLTVRGRSGPLLRAHWQLRTVK